MALDSNGSEDDGSDPGLDGAIETRQLRNAVRQRLFGKAPEPIEIGRFRVLKRVGSGGMGVVYAAYDNDLDRKVAVKLLRRTGRKRSARWRERLRREAQTLARLSHPHVVQIYEAGEHDEQVFIAMEFVDGPNLRQWCEAAPRRWREILAKTIEAGRGLAAAHAAGVVHRDFKPENVVVGNDGRVRVLDFGLARHESEAQPSPEQLDELSSLSLTKLTRSDLLVGTPAYMAPEQFRRDSADERTDQFCFCVALYESLYGERPFPGRTIGQLEKAVHEGAVRPPNDAGIPSWLRRVILKGLSPQPSARYPSMGHLLDALARDPAILARRASLIVLGLAMFVGLGALWRVSDRALLAQAQTLRQERDVQRSRVAQLEDESRRRRDQLILDEVEARLSEDPTWAIATLGELSETSDHWTQEAPMLAADAVERGVAFWMGRLRKEEVPQAMCRTGRWLVTRSPTDGLVRLMDLDRLEQRTLGRTERVALPAIAFDRDARHLAVGGIDGALVIFEGHEFQRKRPLARVSEHVDSLTFAPRGDTLYAWGRAGDVLRIDVSSGERTTLGTHDDGVRRLAAAGANGDSVVTEDMFGRLRWWTPGAKVPLELDDGMSPFSLHEDGTRLAYLTGEGVLTVRTPDDVVAEIPVALGLRPRAMAISPSGWEVALGDADGVVTLFDLRTGSASPMQLHEDQVQRIGYSSEGNFMLSTSDDQTVGVVELRSGRWRRLHGHDGVALWAMTQTQDGPTLTTAGWGGEVRRWKLGDLNALFRIGDESVDRFIPSDDALLLVTPSELLSWKPGEAPPRVVADHKGVSCATTLNDGAVISGSIRGEVRLTAPDGSVRTLLAPSDRTTLAIAVNDTESRLAVSFDAGPVVLVELDDLGERGTQRVALEGFVAVALAFAGDRLLAIGWGDDHHGYVKAIGADGQIESLSDLGSNGMGSVAFSPDGTHIAYTNFNRQTWVWDRDETRQLGKQDGLVVGASFSSNGRNLATVTKGGTLVVWDLKTGRHRKTSLGGQPPTDVAYVGDGRKIAVAKDGGTVLVVPDDLPRDASPLRQWVRTATNFTAEQ